MSNQPELPAVVALTSNNDDLKRLSSEADADSKPLGSVQSTQDEPAAARKPAGIWATFTGADRQKLKDDEKVVWNQGAGTWAKGVQKKAKSVFTVRFLTCLIAGQALAMTITGTSVLTTKLSLNNWSMPTFQTFFVYFFLALVYTPFTIYRYGFRAWGKMIVTDGWKYFFLAAVDVEANFLVVKAYGYTDLLSCMLLNAWATPACMIFAFFLVKARYHWTQVIAVLVCIAGLALTVVSDYILGKNVYDTQNKVLGDIFMLLGATGYGLSNSLEEFFVRKRPLYEVVGQLGLWGCIINGIQGAALEHELFHTSQWTGTNIGYLVGYTLCMLFLYTLAPILFRLSSSPFYNISLLTGNFYGLAIGLSIFGYEPYWLYFVSYVVVLVGLVFYFSVARPEKQADTVVQARGKQLRREEEGAGRFTVGA